MIPLFSAPAKSAHSLGPKLAANQKQTSLALLFLVFSIFVFSMSHITIAASTLFSHMTYFKIVQPEPTYNVLESNPF